MVSQKLISIPCNNGIVEELFVLCFAHSIAPLPDITGEITSNSPGASAETVEQSLGHDYGFTTTSSKAKSRLIDGPCGFHAVDLDYLPQVLIAEFPAGIDSDVTIHNLDDEEIIIARHVRPSLCPNCQHPGLLDGRDLRFLNENLICIYQLLDKKSSLWRILIAIAARNGSFDIGP